MKYPPTNSTNLACVLWLVLNSYWSITCFQISNQEWTTLIERAGTNAKNKSLNLKLFKRASLLLA